jgi:ribulose-5-phosphate 4-epimerase/fuculose-1-phosphate aldolase
MNDEALLREKAATLTRMLNLQGTIGMFGHVSVRVPGTDKCFISPGASTDKTVVRPEHMFVYNIDGTIIEHPGGLIPLEWRIHTRIHRDRSDAMCVVHLHAPHARALGVAGKEIKPVFLHGSFLCTGVPTWNDPRLVVNDAQAPPTCRARSASTAARRCAVTAASWWARAPRRRFSPARSWRRTRKSSFRPRSWAAPFP